jgi:hypothetical protein
MRIVRLLLALLCLPLGALAAGPTFTGGLRFVSPGAITVRLSDGVVIDARLSQKGELTAERISAQFKLADRVQITCRNIQGGWDESVKRYHSLELTRIQFIRAPSAEEVAQVVASLSWQVGDNLLKPPPETPKPPKATDPEGLERVREVNLARAEKMPNFVADEGAVRSVRGKGNSKWKQVDTVESEVAFKGAEDARQHIRINGKPYTTATGWIPGVNWGLGFAGYLNSVFDRDCANTFELGGHEVLRGKPVTVYRFQSPQDGCFGAGVMGYRQYNAARTGRILVEDLGGNVIQMEFEVIQTASITSGNDKEVFSWDDVTIGDASHLLPVAADYNYPWANGDLWHITVQYKNHRHFESGTTIQFQQESVFPK